MPFRKSARITIESKCINSANFYYYIDYEEYKSLPENEEIGYFHAERQANDWYGGGDDMIFIDGEPWPPSLHGIGTEDYFNMAFCPTKEFYTPWHVLTVYSGDEDGFKWDGRNSMYRFHPYGLC